MKDTTYSKILSPSRMQITLMILTLLLTLTGCTSTVSDGPLLVQTAVAATGPIETHLDLTGVLLPNQTVNISAKLSGEVKSSPFAIGDVVKVGDVLFELDGSTVNAQIAQAQSGLVTAQSAYDASRKQAEVAMINLEAAQKAYEDTVALYASGAVSETVLSDSKTRLDLAKKQVENANGPQKNQAASSVETAQAAINTLDVQKGNTKVISPINGVVVTRALQQGEMASMSAPLMTLADLSTLKMKGTISQENIPYLKVGQTVDIHVDVYPDQVFKGTISSIGPMALSTGKIFPIEVVMSNDTNLLAGLSGRTAIKMASTGHVIIPLSAVTHAEGISYVFTIENGLAMKKTVVTGLKNNDAIEILSGLNSGEIVATNNTHILQNEMRVTSGK